MIEALKDHLAPKTFGLVAYVCLIVYFICGMTVLAVTAALSAGEFEKFSCIVHATYVEKNVLFNAQTGLRLAYTFVWFCLT